MAAFYIVLGLILVAITLWDTFETIVLPRSVIKRLRLSRYLFLGSWKVYRKLASLIRSDRSREGFLSIYGPLSLLMLFAAWGSILILGFALFHNGTDLLLSRGDKSFAEHLYLSGTTFFTLGIGDEHPTSAIGRFLAVVEAGIGFGFLALVISYLPVLYQSFSRREAAISLLNSRAGVTPTATGLIIRYLRHGEHREMNRLLRQNELWSAELLENYISYPILAFYRSQQERQSWLASLTVVLDTCTLLQIGLTDHPEWEDLIHDQAELTFAMAVKVVIVLRETLGIPPESRYPDRLPEEAEATMRERLRGHGMSLVETPASQSRFARLRLAYEPDIYALSHALMLEVPPFDAESRPGVGEPERVVLEARSLL